MLPRPSSPDRPSAGPLRRTAQNFALFFPSPPQFSFFLLSLGGPFVEFWWGLKRRGAQMCTFGVLGRSCETLAAPPDRAAGARTRQPENSKRAYFRAPALQKPHQNSTKGPPQEREERKLWRGGKKKARNFGPPTLGCPPFGAHPSGPPSFGGPLFLGLSSHLSGPTPKQAHTLPTILGLGSCFFGPVCQLLFCPNVVFFLSLSI